MKKVNFNEALAQILKDDPRYDEQAYLFLREALGADMHRTFTAIKAAEYARVARTIADVDYDLYLHTV